MPTHPMTSVGVGHAPARITGVYAGVALLWIWLSDRALVWLGFAEDQAFLPSAIKGTAFVVVTAAVLFCLVRREVAAVRRSEGLLRAVVEGTTDAVFVKDENGRYLLCNESAARFIGRPVDDVLDRDDRDLFDAASAERLMSGDRAIMSGGEAVIAEETLTSGGVSRTYHAMKAPYRSESGLVSGLIGISRDISDRKRAEVALREGERRFRELADAIPQIVWTAGPDGSLTFLNARAAEYSGLGTGVLLGWSWEQVIHPDDLPGTLARWARILTSWVPEEIEFRIRRADGEYRWHVTRQTPARDARAAVTGWYGTCTDIEDRKRAEDTLRETEARLREAQRIARMGSWSWDPASDRVWWSDAEFELFGVDRRTFRPSLDAFLALLHPEDRAVAVARVEAMRAGAVEVANDFRVVRPDGACIWIHTRARATRDASGALVRVEGIDQDITARRTSELRFREQEMLVREAAELARVGGWGFDPLTLQSDWTPQVARIYGLDPATPPPVTDALKFFSPDQRPGLEAALAAATRDGVPHDLELRLTAADGEAKWVRTICRPIVAGGRVVRVRGSLQDITDRKHAEVAVRESEERLRVALQGARGGVWDLDLATGVVWWSPEVYALMGTPPQADTAVPAALELVDAGDRERVAAALADAIARRVDYHCEFRVRGGRWLSSHARLICDADGRPARLLGISMDVTDRMAAAEALRASEERYRLLVDTLPTSVHVIDGGRLTYCNPACVALFGAASEADLLGKTPYELLHPDSHRPVAARIATIVEGKVRAPLVVVKIARLDGQVRTVHAVATPIPNGAHPDTHLVCLNDITEQERATTLLRTVLDSVSDAILTVDERGVMESANPAAVRQFGYAESDLLGRTLDVLMHAPHPGGCGAYIAHYLRTGVPRVIGTGREVDCRRRDGTRFPAELTVTEFTLEGERHFTGVLRDITERRRLEDQFRQSQKMEAVGRLAGGVAHDFNNLLTVINGYCELLMMSDAPAGRWRESVSAVRDAGERAARLTQQLLAFSRKAILEPKVLDLNDLVSESAKLLRRLIGEDIILAVVTAPTPVRVKADPGQLEQVVMNLVVNARDAMPTGGRLTLETAVVARGDGDAGRFARLCVSDTGRGMTDEVKGKVFEPFFTTKGVGKGTGLGLAVVHGVVTQSGGQIAIESTVGVGTTFHLLLPLVSVGEAGAEAGTTAVATRGAETVLLVEDEDAVRAIARLSLETQGYTVLEADGGAAALRQAETHPGEIHLLVSDVVMPEMGGRQLLEAVRRHRPGVRVLFMSGYTDDAVLLHGVVEATDAFLQKPFTPLGLARKVREVLDAPAR